MKSKNSTPRYSFTTGREGKDYYWYRVIGDGMTLIEIGYGRSRHDASECARAAIRHLEAGTHPTQPCYWQDCIPADPGWGIQPAVSADFSYLPF